SAARSTRLRRVVASPPGPARPSRAAPALPLPSSRSALRRSRLHPSEAPWRTAGSRRPSALACSLPFQPAQQIGEEDFGVFLEFERVMGAGIFVYFLIRSGEALHEGSGTGIVDDAIVLGKQQQDRQANMGNSKSQIQIE